MSKGIILYKSKYGSTKKYADWLTDATGFDCFETNAVNASKAKQYEKVVLLGGIYASGISGLKFLKQVAPDLVNKKVAVFCVGASPYDKKQLAQIKERLLKDALEAVPLFYGRGAWNEEAMTIIDRTLCNVLQRSLAKKDPSTYEPWMAALMEAKGQKSDWTDPSCLDPLIEYLQD